MRYKAQHPTRSLHLVGPGQSLRGLANIERSLGYITGSHNTLFGLPINVICSVNPNSVPILSKGN